jgi:DNA repair photolyase
MSTTPSYRATAPLIHPSKLTTVDNGGVGKDLSEGWCLNFAVGCTHGCKFCYVDVINKAFAGGRFKNNEAAKQEVKEKDWGDYFMVPEGLDEAIAATPWKKWAGKEVMLSSMHDAWLPELQGWARKILTPALEAGVRFCIQTRSLLVLKDLDLLARYRDQVRLQVSVATMDAELGRRIEPRVPTPLRRFDVLRKAKAAKIPTGVILAPIFPSLKVRPSWMKDLADMIGELRGIRPDHIYGESLHVRGKNLDYLLEALGEPIDTVGLPMFDQAAEIFFHAQLKQRGLKGTWWPEHRSHRGPPQSTLAVGPAGGASA